MSAEETVARVLAAHRPRIWRSFTNDNNVIGCCRKTFGNATRKGRRGDAERAWEQFEAHQAAEVVTALGLREEWGTDWGVRGDHVQRHASRGSAQSHVAEAGRAADRVVRRYVTPWQPVEETDDANA